MMTEPTDLTPEQIQALEDMVSTPAERARTS